MVKSISETVVDTLGEVDPQKYMQEQLGQAQTAAGGIEGAKEKYGVKGYQSGGELLIKPKFKKTPKNRKKSSLKEGAKEMAKDMAKMNAPFMVGVPVFLGSTIGSSKLSEYREKKKKEQIGRGKKATPEIKAEGAKQGGMMKTKKLKEGRKTIEPKYTPELGMFSYKDRSKEFEKPKKGTNIIKQLEDDKLKFDPHLKFTKVDPEKRTIKGFKIGKKGGEIYFEKKFKQGGMVCRGQGKARKKNFKVY